MSTTVALRFVAGRYHATPWDHIANEAIAEWPPAPWRLLRALVSSWKRTLPDLPEQRVLPLLEALAAPPRYHLPRATAGHTRHFMPWEKGWKWDQPAPRTSVFDPFVAVLPEEPAFVTWPGALSEEQRATLQALAANLHHLGRSESWCEAGLAGAPSGEPNCWPLAEGEKPPEGFEVVRVLTPQQPLDHRALCVDTKDLRSKLLDPTRPPGSRWVLYSRRSDCFAPSRPAAKEAARAPVEVVRFALAGSVLPHVTDAVKVGDAARRAAMSWYGRLNGRGASPALSGKAADGQPLQGHRHAHYLPTDDDGDGFLDHLTVWAPMRLGEREQEALARLSMEHLNLKDDRPPLRLPLLAMGDAARPEGLAGPARAWVSTTPFVLTRHPKLRGDTQGGAVPKRVVDGPEDQLRRELASRGFPEPAKVETLPQAQLRGRSLPWLAFHRWRGRGARVEHATGFRLKFAEPVKGPIALGYGAHYGLGLFVPDDRTAP